ncbi:glycosyltransferase family A protein [Macrococcus carouselicus]|uniref:Glycosyltransferase family 2 protein n=1 Tax=Macrococcus carouselicus TaxID=69969 RepID=A0A9Q8FQC7_9STAP|nr:glycosyltransferase family A protein [Macrococcus carouselicus]TDM03847.1 glycosyltransferase family 2 protein [Macrococcus carouselicus]
MIKKNVCVLVSTMYQRDYSILKKMNISSAAVIINQDDIEKREHFDFKGYPIKFISKKERGVGKSRNLALSESTGSISVIADDDLVYVQNYEEIIIKAFEEFPDADMIVFEVPSINDQREDKAITKRAQVRWYNSFRYPAYKMAVRTESVKKNNLQFSLEYGGGARYSHGEDSIFITDFLKKGLKVYSYPVKIAEVNHQESTWFTGHDESFFTNKGALFYEISTQYYQLLALQFLARHRSLYKENQFTFTQAYKMMMKGADTRKQDKEGGENG